MDYIRKKLDHPYTVLLFFCLLLIVFAFVFDTPANILGGMQKIFMSRGILITDYIELAGQGAALVNASLVGMMSLLLMKITKVTPNGAIIMAVWLNCGFAFFGKNVLNMLPLVLGVWLYATLRREPFSSFALAALLSATLAPIVSEIALGDSFGSFGGSILGVLIGTACGVVIGFVFSPIAAHAVRVHAGYNLYNMGFAGGLISTILVASLYSLGIEVPTSLFWASGHNLSMSIFLYILSALLLGLGFFLGKDQSLFKEFKKILRHSGRLVTDFYLLHKNSIYINMGLLCALSTTLVLVLGGELNGPTIGGILTVTGFGCFGKHPKNIAPILLGALLSSWANKWDVTSPANMLAILFSTCLAPVAGQFGALWGIAAGFLHVLLVHHIGYLSNGLNLYNNGFAAGFVVLFLLPIMSAFRREKEDAPNI